MPQSRTYDGPEPRWEGVGPWMDNKLEDLVSDLTSALLNLTGLYAARGLQLNRGGYQPLNEIDAEILAARRHFAFLAEGAMPALLSAVGPMKGVSARDIERLRKEANLSELLAWSEEGPVEGSASSYSLCSQQGSMHDDRGHTCVGSLRGKDKAEAHARARLCAVLIGEKQVGQ